MSDFALTLEQIPASVWWALVAIVGVAVLAVVNRPRPKPQPAQPGGNQPPADVALVLPPAPKFMGFLFLRPYYQRGERIILNTGPETHGCDPTKPIPYEKQTHGIVDNGSGPYMVKLRAWDRASGSPVPVYGHDGGRQLANDWVESGFFDVYALSQRSYSAVGSLVNCNEFVPLFDDVPAMLTEKSGCKPSPCPVTPPDAGLPPSGLSPMMLELQIRNRYGVADAPLLYEIPVQLKSCGPSTGGDG